MLILYSWFWLSHSRACFAAGEQPVQRCKDTTKIGFEDYLSCLSVFAPGKGIQDTLGFWIPRRGFRIPITGFQIFFSGTWIPDSNCQWYSGFLLLYSGFQGPGFRIPQTKISKIPDSKCKNFPDSGIRIPLHGATVKVIWHIWFHFLFPHADSRASHGASLLKHKKCLQF